MNKRSSDKVNNEIQELTTTTVWSLTETQVVEAWESKMNEEDFFSSEERLLNIIRMAFEVVHYNPDNEREKTKYEDGEWTLISRKDEKKGKVAFRRKVIKSLNDLTYDNIRHISAADMLQLVLNNFGGGWDSISLSIRDIIESAFEISSTTLPPSRLHIEGGAWERKLADGFEGIEVPKGGWIEAIFAKKKAPMLKRHFATDADYDEEGNRVDASESDEDEDVVVNDEYEREQREEAEEDAEAERQNEDETFYSSYSPEANVKMEDDDDTEGLSVID